MRNRFECGVWEIFVPGVEPGMAYKYEIRAGFGELLAQKADPYAFEAEVPPRTASITSTVSSMRNSRSTLVKASSGDS